MYIIKNYGKMMTSILNDLKLIFEASPKDLLLAKLNGVMLLKHVLWKRDHKAMLNATVWFEQKMWDVSQVDMSKASKELAIRQLSALLPYVMPLDHTRVNIPVLQNGEWVSVKYNVTPIALLPKWVPSSDQFYALALTADGYDSQLLFKGTTYPADQGCWSTVVADLFPLMDIGKLIMMSGKSRISQWAQTQADIHVIGQSLGGALANMTHDIPNVRTITAINPALPYAKRGGTQGVVRTMVVDSDDTVSRIGQIDDDINVVQTTLDAEGAPIMKRKWLAHLQPRLSHAGIKTETLTDNNKQQHVFTNRFMWYWVLRAVAFLVILPVYLIHLIYAYARDLCAWIVNQGCKKGMMVQRIIRNVSSKGMSAAKVVPCSPRRNKPVEVELKMMVGNE